MTSLLLTNTYEPTRDRYITPLITLVYTYPPTQCASFIKAVHNFSWNGPNVSLITIDKNCAFSELSANLEYPENLSIGLEPLEQIFHHKGGTPYHRQTSTPRPLTWYPSSFHYCKGRQLFLLLREWRGSVTGAPLPREHFSCPRNQPKLNPIISNAALKPCSSTYILNLTEVLYIPDIRSDKATRNKAGLISVVNI